MRKLLALAALLALAGSIPASANLWSSVASNPVIVQNVITEFTVFTSGASGTFTPNANSQVINLKTCGGGGGSSGSQATVGLLMSIAGSGAGGGCLEKTIPTRSLFNGGSYVVGGTGSAGTAGNNNGGTGGTSTFTDTASTVYTATGGAGGICRCNFNASGAAVGLNFNIVAGGTGTNGDINVSGGTAGSEMRVFGGTAAFGEGGAGGTNWLAPGSNAGHNICNNVNSGGLAGLAFGGGAGSGCTKNNGTNQAGAAGSGGVMIIQGWKTAGGASVFSQTILTSGSGTYSPSGPIGAIRIRMCGGGGGSSGVSAPTSTNISHGGAGSGAGCLEKMVTSRVLFNGATYAIGAKGTGGTAGNNNGTDGGNTTFTLTNSIVLTAAKGLGGACNCNATNNGSTASTKVGGSATNGDLNIAGAGTGAGGYNLNNTSNEVRAQAGAGSWMAPPTLALGCAGNSQPGTAAVGFGGGGAAACATNTAAAQAGANGSPGIIIIDEYN